LSCVLLHDVHLAPVREDGPFLIIQYYCCFSI